MNVVDTDPELIKIMEASGTAPQSGTWYQYASFGWCMDPHETNAKSKFGV